MAERQENGKFVRSDILKWCEGVTHLLNIFKHLLIASHCARYSEYNSEQKDLASALKWLSLQQLRQTLLK